MKFILGTKQYMTQLFDESGVAHAATVIAVTPMTVTQVKTAEKDGYAAVQVGTGETKEKHVNKAQRPKGLFRHFRETALTEGENVAVGDVVSLADTFAVGDMVDVVGTSKAKGFQGVVKRHGFSGGPRTHGQKHSEREAGSIGGGGRAGGRVVKGMRMAGRMGGDRITVRNLKVLAVVPERNELILEGAVPGYRGSVVEVRGA